MTGVVVLSPGSVVRVGEPKGIAAKVFGVWVGPEAHVMYDVVWYSGRSRNVARVERYEVFPDPDAHATQTIGFA